MGATYTILNPAKSKEPSLRCQAPSNLVKTMTTPLFRWNYNHRTNPCNCFNVFWPSSGTGSSHSKSSTWQRWSFRCQWERTPGAIHCVFRKTHQQKGQLGTWEQPGVFCLSYAPTYSLCAPQRHTCTPQTVGSQIGLVQSSNVCPFRTCCCALLCTVLSLVAPGKASWHQVGNLDLGIGANKGIKVLKLITAFTK